MAFGLSSQEMRKSRRPVPKYIRIKGRLVKRSSTRSEIERFFEGMEIVPPYEGAGQVVAHVGLWGAEDPESADDDASRWFYAAVARKP